MSDKYIIKNCPCYWHIGEDDGCSLENMKCCENDANCLIKQIAIMCNHAIHGAKATGHFNFLGEKILGLLDIQEVK